MLTIEGEDMTFLKMVSIFLMKKYEILIIIIQYNRKISLFICTIN
jgi:hypothetical protein